MKFGLPLIRFEKTIKFVKHLLTLDWHKSTKTVRLKKRILIPLAIAFIVLLGVYVLNVYQTQNEEISKNVSKTLEQVDVSFDKLCESDVELMKATIMMMSLSTKIQSAWLGRDRTTLMELTSPILKTLLENHHFTHFYFHDINRVNFLRVHKPEKHGDIINRFTMLEAHKTGRTSAGMELGPLGTLTLRVVYPWRVRGNLTGYVEMGIEVEHIIKELHKILEVELYVSVYKEFLNRKDWKQGIQFLHRERNWDQLPSSVIISQTLDATPQSFGDLLVPGRHNYMEVTPGIKLSLDGKSYRMGIIPLFDVGGNEIGDIVALYDVTKLLANSRHSILVFTSTCIIVSIVLFVLFTLILDRVEIELTKHRKHLQKLVEDRTNKLSATNMALKKEINEHQIAEEEKQKLQSQLIHSQKMESIGMLAGGVAHDFNNILTTINGYADLTLIKMSLDDPLRMNLEYILSAGKRAAHFTQQLLTFSSKQIVKAEVLNLNGIIENMDDLLVSLVEENIEVTKVLNDALWNFKADSSQMEQVVMNLVINANDAMQKEGKLTIKTKNIVAEHRCSNEDKNCKEPEYVLLEISDTGYGMTKKEKERIFEPFFTTKEKGKGTGLGLSTVYGIIKRHNGFIDVLSEPGKGSSFKVYLPRTKEKIESKEIELITKDIARGTETILLVEDEKEVRGFTMKLLTFFGYSVIEAVDGLDGFRKCKIHKSNVDLVLTDVIMPKMNGRELSKNLNGCCHGVEVLFMSGYTEKTISDNGVFKNDINILQKPFTPQSLAQKVRMILDEKKVICNKASAAI